MGILHVSDNKKYYLRRLGWQSDRRRLAQPASKLLAEPDWPNISCVIGDAQTASDTASIGEKEIDSVAALFVEHPETVMKKRLAVLANDMFGRSRKLSTLLSRHGTSAAVFNQLDTACTFLGIDPVETGETLEQIRLRLRSGS